MKKIALTFAAVAALGVAACGEKAPENVTDTDINVTTEEAVTDVNAATEAADNALDNAAESVDNAANAVDNAADNAM